MNPLQSLLQIPWLLRTRRNHGLEHASIHILTARRSHSGLAGHSDAGGFWLIGEVQTEAVEAAVQEALQRFRAGQAGLAVHPNCGTNLVTAAAVTGGMGNLALRGSQRNTWALRLPLALLASVLGLLLARPLGGWLQKYITTSADMGDLQVISIRRSQRGRTTLHRVETFSS
ncbi:MAG: hypothetical protein KIT46_04105 [Anaerolineales bacterium]|nr:hypothetical protein [Anaerolineales bacterium]MCW5855211.1 hypothetical protein [Anaerolineales bacterium]